MILFVLSACIDARDPLQFPVHFQGSPGPFVLEEGVLTVERAELTAADVRLEAPPDLVWVPSLWSAAVAHPGHEFAGAIRAELLDVWTLDLLGSAELGEARAFEGDVITGSFEAMHLSLSGDLSGTPVVLELPIDRQVGGIDAFGTLSAQTPPRLEFTIDLQHVLDQVIWTDTDRDGTITTADEAVLNTAMFGITSTASWALHLEENP